MAHTFCYALCRACTTLNHTDASALACVSACAALALVWFSETEFFLCPDSNNFIYHNV